MITVMAVSLDSLNVFASKRLPVVEGAQRFELTQADRLEGAPPLPRQFRVQATCDGASTGDEKTFFVGMALTSTDAAGIDLDLVLARQVLSAPPPRPIRGNPKGSLYNDRPKKP